MRFSKIFRNTFGIQSSFGNNHFINQNTFSKTKHFHKAVLAIIILEIKILLRKQAFSQNSFGNNHFINQNTFFENKTFSQNNFGNNHFINPNTFSKTKHFYINR